jgi:hypothetical protein
MTLVSNVYLTHGLMLLCAVAAAYGLSGRTSCSDAHLRR